MAATGFVTNIQRCSTEDGPGIRTTVFFKGCPMNCIWCHNIEAIDSEPTIVWYAVKCIGDEACVKICPENALELTSDGMLIDRDLCTVCGDCEEVCPTGAIKVMGKMWTAEDLVEELLRDEVFFSTSNGGVTLSGGEPTYQADFARDVASRLKDKGIHVALDTCGYMAEKTLTSIIPFVDLFLYDLKVKDTKKHEKYTGVPLERVLTNAKIITDSKKPVWIRTPVIPGYTDEEENIRLIARFIVENMPIVERYDLLAFNRMCTEKYVLFDLEYPLKDVELVTTSAMENLAEIAREEGIKLVTWSGMTKDQKSTSMKADPTC